MRAAFAPYDHAPKEYDMISGRKRVMTLFVERLCQQWVVRDPDGNFWLLPSVDNPWEQRQPFYPTAESEHEPVHGHYKYMLGLPF
jgi:hypothetical protein